MPTTDTASLIVSCKIQGQANLDRINQSLTGMDGFAKRAIGTFAGFLAGAKIFQFGKQAVGAFQETQDAAWQFSQTFQNLQGSAEKVFKDFSNTYGLSEKSARSMLSMTGDLLKGAGFSEESALKLSEATAKMATDLAGYRNYSGGAQGATMALSKAMLGEAESMKSLGVVINQNSDQYKEFFKAFRGGGMSIEEVRKKMGEFSSSDAKVTAQWESMIKLMANGKNLSEQEAKAMTALALTLKQTKQAVGDWIKEGESFSQTMMNQKELMTDLSSNIGAVIYDTLGLNDIMTGANKKIKELIDYIKINGPAISATAAFVVADLVGYFKTMMLNAEPITSAFTATFKNIVNYLDWFSENFDKIMLHLPQIAGAVALDILDSFTFINRQIVELFKNVGKGIWEAIKTGNISESFSKMIDNIVNDAARNFGNLGKRTELALAAAGASKAPGLVEADYRAWTDPEYKKKRLADIEKEVEESKKKAEKRAYTRLNEGTGLTDTKNNAEGATSALEQFNKTLNKLRQTAIDAVHAGSVESVRLQSRVLRVASGSGVSQVAKGQEAQKTAESSVKTAEHTKKMVALLEKIAAKPAMATSTVG